MSVGTSCLLSPRRLVFRVGESDPLRIEKSGAAPGPLNRDIRPRGSLTFLASYPLLRQRPVFTTRLPHTAAMDATLCNVVYVDNTIQQDRLFRARPPVDTHILDPTDQPDTIPETWESRTLEENVSLLADVFGDGVFSFSVYIFSL